MSHATTVTSAPVLFSTTMVPSIVDPAARVVDGSSNRTDKGAESLAVPVETAVSVVAVDARWALPPQADKTTVTTATRSSDILLLAASRHRPALTTQILRSQAGKRVATRRTKMPDTAPPPSNTDCPVRAPLTSGTRPERSLFVRQGGSWIVP
jgi:hypothetical protein